MAPGGTPSASGSGGWRRGEAPVRAPDDDSAARRCSGCGRLYFGAQWRHCPEDGTRLVEEPAARELDLVGQLVDGRHEVLALEARGSVASVYRVRHRILGKEFALKRLRRELVSDLELCSRFLREARALASLEHPNVVRVEDCGRLAGGEPYLLMEDLEGQSLARLIREHAPFSVEAALDVAVGIADGLTAAHLAGVVHRDLTPANVCVLHGRLCRSSVRLIDFGLARVRGEVALTRPGVAVGTPSYMSPEQALGREVDCRADIYSLGAFVYEMVAGRPPFSASSYLTLVHQHVYAHATPLEELVAPAFVGELLDAVVGRCLAKEPSHRPGSARDCAAQFEAALLRLGLSPPEDEDGAFAGPGSRPVSDVGSDPFRRGSQRTILYWSVIGCIVGLAAFGVALAFLP